MAVHPGGFSDRDNYERALALEAEREAREAAQSEADRAIQAANEVDAAKADAEIPTTNKFDWLGLASPDDHPLVVDARSKLETVRKRHADAVSSMAKAQAELQAAELAAAHGRRDDAALTRARTRIEAADSDLRITATGVTLAEDHAKATRVAVCFAGAANLKAKHREAIRAMDKALAEAAKHSRLAVALENQSHVFAGGPGLRKRAPKVIQPVAWRKEFGPSPSGYYDYWRKHVVGRLLD